MPQTTIQMSRPSEILEIARKLIRNPGHWIQCASATDRNHKEVNPKSSEAVCYCSTGAIEATAKSAFTSQVDQIIAYDLLAEAIPDRFFDEGNSSVSKIQRFNDHQNTHHSDVMDMFDKAIKQAKEHKL